ncbi:PLP-dependent aminotransferase family protein [Kribbella sp. NPDC051620]|uniref:PLP-dependent aminotransferase family protein n=1 Tax=Kribbella sp. NPDC051620 TaxID=3364120 RepID=UPI003794B3E2
MDRSGDPAALASLIGHHLTEHSGGLYRRLADAIGALIGSAELPVGARLPAERPLAEALAVSRSTVVAAYDELRARGLVESRRGSGTTVAPAASKGRSRADKRMPTGYGESLFHRIAHGPSEVIAMTYAVDPGIPELAAEVEDLARTELPLLLQGVGYHPRGLQVLRERIADHFAESGLPTTPDEIVVTSGAHQAIALVTQMYLRTGAAVVIEQPSWPGCFDLFAAAGGRVVGVPLDDAGVRPDLLAAAFSEHQPAMLFVMPTFHNPTGRLMSSARRRQVAELAARHGVVVVEARRTSGQTQSACRSRQSGDRTGADRAIVAQTHRTHRGPGGNGDDAKAADESVADKTPTGMAMGRTRRRVRIVDQVAGYRRADLCPGRAEARGRGGGGPGDGSDGGARRPPAGAVQLLRRGDGGGS